MHYQNSQVRMIIKRWYTLGLAPLVVMTVEEESVYFHGKCFKGLPMAEEEAEPWDGPQISILDSPTMGPQCYQPHYADGLPDILPSTQSRQYARTATIEEPKVMKHMGRRRRCRAMLQYTQFHCSGASICDTAAVDELTAEFQTKRFPGDLYTPTWIRGRGNSREGLCSLCVPPVWFRMKQSAYW